VGIGMDRLSVFGRTVVRIALGRRRWHLFPAIEELLLDNHEALTVVEVANKHRVPRQTLQYAVDEIKKELKAAFKKERLDATVVLATPETDE
jgi:hypothetical protein